MKEKKSKEQIKRLPIVFPIDLHKFAESGEIPEEIHVLPIGRWNHPVYGVLTITSEDIAEFKANFDKDLRKGIPITAGHESFDEKPAMGWFKELHDRGGNGLYATVEWTKEGMTLLKEKSFKYFSPEFYSEFEDPETREIHTNVLVGGALTNKPYFKELEAIVLSEHIINNKLNFNDMNLKDILGKKVEDLTSDEKTFLTENKDQLNEDQLATFGSVFETEKKEEEKEEAKEEKAEEKKEEEKEEKTEEEKEEKEEEAKEEPVEASEFKTDKDGNVKMTMAEAKTLQEKANAGYNASEKLRKQEIKVMSDKLIYSEQNSKGKILPKHGEKVFSFMNGLTEVQRKAFAEIVDNIPASKMFKEKGSAEAGEGSAVNEIDTKAKKMMSENKEMKYSEAVNQVCSENKELAARYESEL